MHVLQIGNGKPPHSTENHLHRALLENGCRATFLQEDDPGSFASAASILATSDVDFVLWTRTGWDWDRNGYPGGRVQANADQHAMLRTARALGIPTVGYHLDIWHGLKRAVEVDVEPFFHCSLLITADGGHDQEWAKRGINHLWMPPGVSRAECEIGTAREEFRSKIAFVGSWSGGYHPEHRHRHALVQWLQTNFRRDCAFWPKHGQPAVRGKDLQDLYASVDVVVGDSCFAGLGVKNYWSDRIPETLGRGGLLIHPNVPGLDVQFPKGTMLTWDAGNWDALGEQIEWALTHPDEADDIRRAGREHVLARHTYEHRMETVLRLIRNWQENSEW